MNAQQTTHTNRYLVLFRILCCKLLCKLYLVCVVLRLNLFVLYFCLAFFYSLFVINIKETLKNVIQETKPFFVLLFIYLFVVL